MSTAVVWCHFMPRARWRQPGYTLSGPQPGADGRFSSRILNPVLTAVCPPSPQEEERERRMDFVPDESAVNTELIEVRTRPKP